MAEPLPVETPAGQARLFLDLASEPTATLLLGHGAGGGVDAPDLALLARVLPELGVSVVRFEQPWRTAGRRIAVAPPQLDVAWRAAVAWLVAQPWMAGGLFVGGRSAGARVACRTADELGARGVVCLAFPLHPPGRPDRSRIGELLAPSVPRLVLQGTNDAFGGPADVRTASAGASGIRVVDLPGADHGYRVAKGSPCTAADLRTVVAASVHAFVTGG